MDRSFLSQPAVIAASRAFVCVRLASYEDKEEAEFLKKLSRTRSGELENTVFTLLSPDGERQLAHGTRSAKQTFGDAKRMVEAMNRVAVSYEPKGKGELLALPTAANVRLALDIAACDNQPLVIAFAKDAKSRRDIEEQLKPLVWTEPFLGHFIYAVASDAKELNAIEGAKPETGIIVVQPDQFGLKGRVLKQATGDVNAGVLLQSLTDGLALHQTVAKSFGSHVQAGHRQGVFWETALPVTDPMEQQARERGRKQAKP